MLSERDTYGRSSVNRFIEVSNIIPAIPQSLYNIRINFSPHSIPAIFRISYIWYSFVGTALTVIFGVIISLISDKISKTKIMHLSAGGSNPTINQKVIFVGATAADDHTTESIFMTDKNTERPLKYHLNGIDNHAVNVEEM